MIKNILLSQLSVSLLTNLFSGSTIGPLGHSFLLMAVKADLKASTLESAI